MKEFWNAVQAVFVAVGGWLGHYLGGVDGLLYVLLAFVALDYFTGVMCAIADRQLSSEIGFKGCVRKCLIFALVGVGQLVDTYIIGQGSVLRTAVIFFYLSNEGLSLVENAAHLGLPVPEQLKDVLVQLHRKAEEKQEGDTGGGLAGTAAGRNAGEDLERSGHKDRDIAREMAWKAMEEMDAKLTGDKEAEDAAGNAEEDMPVDTEEEKAAHTGKDKTGENEEGEDEQR